MVIHVKPELNNAVSRVTALKRVSSLVISKKYTPKSAMRDCNA